MHIFVACNYFCLEKSIRCGSRSTNQWRRNPGWHAVWGILEPDKRLSKWFYDTSTRAALQQPTVVLLWGRPLASWLLVLGERGGHKDLHGLGRLSVIPYVHGRTELYCAQACLA
jgi:hypothetical protein